MNKLLILLPIFVLLGMSALLLTSQPNEQSVNATYRYYSNHTNHTNHSNHSNHTNGTYWNQLESNYIPVYYNNYTNSSNHSNHTNGTYWNQRKLKQQIPIYSYNYTNQSNHSNKTNNTYWRQLEQNYIPQYQYNYTNQSNKTNNTYWRQLQQNYIPQYQYNYTNQSNNTNSTYWRKLRMSHRNHSNNSNHTNGTHWNQIGFNYIPLYSNYTNNTNQTNSTYPSFNLTQSQSQQGLGVAQCPGAQIFGMDVSSKNNSLSINCTDRCPKKYAYLAQYTQPGLSMYNACLECTEEGCAECRVGALNPWQQSIICTKAQDGYYVAGGIISQQSSYQRVEKCPSVCVTCGDVYNGRPFQDCTVPDYAKLFGCLQEMVYTGESSPQIQCSKCMDGYTFKNGGLNSPGGYCVMNN